MAAAESAAVCPASVTVAVAAGSAPSLRVRGEQAAGRLLRLRARWARRTGSRRARTPATAVASSQRRNSAASASGSGRSIWTNGVPSAAMSRSVSRAFASGVAGQVEAHHHAIASVLGGRPEFLARNRHDAAAELAGALGHQLFDPETERGKAWRRGQRGLVAAMHGALSHRRAQQHGGVGAERAPGPAQPEHGARPVDHHGRRRAPSGRRAPGRRTRAPSSGLRCRSG